MSNIRWLGHASFQLELAGRIILIDPWLSTDGKRERVVAPACSAKDIKRCDLILLTHEHFDHASKADVGDIVSRTFAHVVGPAETLAELGDAVPARQRTNAREGDRFNLLGVDIEVTEARHPQSVHPVGYVLRTPEGKSVYHAGDTYEFYTMNRFSPDLALLPIGGTFTLDVLSAVSTVKQLRCKRVIPMHYNTFDVIKADVEDFARRVKKDTKAEPVVLRVGDSVEF